MPEHLEQFARQLASWTEAIIEFGRTPFRRVETYPEIVTAEGCISPPLVLWINRQSLMAGGIILIPGKNLDQELENGRHCALALGLRHFVTWESRQVRIWRLDDNRIEEERLMPLAAPDQPDTFRYLLEELLEALKLSAVLGAVPPQQLSPDYFNNLFQITLQQTALSILESYRSQRSSHIGVLRTNDQNCRATETNRFFLLKLLALLLYRKLPETVLPEKLETVINDSIVELPPEISDFFNHQVDEITLPPDAAVGFHHLLLRLRQLSWHSSASRAVESLEKLATHWWGSVEEQFSEQAVVIHPKKPPLNQSVGALFSESPALLAMTVLYQMATKASVPKPFCGNLIQFDENNFPSQEWFARISSESLITTDRRQEIIIALRKSWPGRRFKIRSGQPLWKWELAHLLGLCPSGRQLHLEIPLAALQTSSDDIIWLLLVENFTFNQIKKISPEMLSVALAKNTSQQQIFPVILDRENRSVEWEGNTAQLRTLILLTLALPQEIYAVVRHELVWPAEDNDNDISDENRGWQIFTETGLFKLFVHILSDQNKKRRLTSNLQLHREFHLPCLDTFQLNELERLHKLDRNADQNNSEDQALAKLLSCPALTDIKRPKSAAHIKPDRTSQEITQQLKDNIFQQLEALGLPKFPEQYLYFLDNPELRKYSFLPPLTSRGSLLGQFELEDAAGKTIEGYGEELEQALLLCAEIDKANVELPQDRRQLALLISHYKKDLATLYEQLSQFCFTRIEQSQQARKLISSIWSQTGLPALEWFKER